MLFTPLLRWLQRTSLVAQIVVGLLTGTALALIFPAATPQVALLGTLFIAALKAVAPVLVLILVIALVVFGPGKLPDVGKALGRSLQEFRKATTVAGEETKPEESKTIDVKAVEKEQQAPEKK